MSGESKNPELEKGVPTNKKPGIFKQVTAGVGLRTPSVESSLTGEKIPNTHKYKYQTKDIDSIIDKSELEMLRKKGILFAFKALDKTLKEYIRALNGGPPRHGTIPGLRREVWESPHPLFSEDNFKHPFYDGMSRRKRKITKVEKKKLEDVYMLREKTIRLLDLILFRYPATKILWRPDMTNLLEKMKKDFGGGWELTSEPYYTPGEPPEFYKILDVKKDVTAEEIKKAYRKMALKHHPDKGGDQDTFKKVLDAYEELRDPEKKENYDAATASCWEEKLRWRTLAAVPKPLERDYLMRALRHTRRQMDLFHAWENENPGTNYIYKGRKALHLLHEKVRQYMMVIQEKEMIGGKRKKTRGVKRKSHKKRNKGKRKTKKRRKRKTKRRR